MRYGTYTFTLPSNKEYSVPQLRTLITELENGIGKKITLEEWEGL
ncbi:MAG: type II toxin-antitoxin system HicA family toxin [Nitrospirae bacterium]|nr:type II toxin-antitoxin system HicA family toxin [Nitrospirota bacterium]